MPKVARAEDLLATLLEAAEDAILTLALDGKIQDWSRGAEQFLWIQRGRGAGIASGEPIATL